MFYLLLAVFLLVVFNVLLMFKLLYWVNEIKRYQYSNNVKMLGFIKKELQVARYKLHDKRG